MFKNIDIWCFLCIVGQNHNYCPSYFKCVVHMKSGKYYWKQWTQLIRKCWQDLVGHAASRWDQPQVCYIWLHHKGERLGIEYFQLSLFISTFQLINMLTKSYKVVIGVKTLQIVEYSVICRHSFESFSKLCLHI